MSEQATVQAINQRPVALQPGSIPGVPEGYRIKKIDHVDYDEPYLDSRGTLQHWPYRENPSPYVYVVLEKIEAERELVVTIRVNDQGCPDAKMSFYLFVANGISPDCAKAVASRYKNADLREKDSAS